MLSEKMTTALQTIRYVAVFVSFSFGFVITTAGVFFQDDGATRLDQCSAGTDYSVLFHSDSADIPAVDKGLPDILLIDPTTDRNVIADRSG